MYASIKKYSHTFTHAGVHAIISLVFLAPAVAFSHLICPSHVFYCHTDAWWSRGCLQAYNKDLALVYNKEVLQSTYRETVN